MVFFPVDILDRVIVLNSTAIMVSWSRNLSTGLVQCCPDGESCLTAIVNTHLNSYVFPGLEEYTGYAVSLKGESGEVFIVTYQDSEADICICMQLALYPFGTSLSRLTKTYQMMLVAGLRVESEHGQFDRRDSPKHQRAI